jgi:hypothetical protein
MQTIQTIAGVAVLLAACAGAQYISRAGLAAADRCKQLIARKR